MSVQVGDLAWIRAKAGLKLSDDEVWFTDLQGIPIKNTDGECIPDVPGLAALAAVVQKHGREKVLSALKLADTAVTEWDMHDDGLILRRLAAALAPEGA